MKCNIPSVKNFFLFATLFLLLAIFSGSNIVFAQTPTETPVPTPTPDTSSQDKINELQSQISDLQKKIADAQSQAQTLSSQIAIMDNQINLTELRINATKQQIAGIVEDIKIATKKIVNLEGSLQNLTKILLNRIVVTYEVGTIEPFQVLLVSNTASDFFTRLNYLRIAQMHDKELLYQTQQAKMDYANQKTIFEDKKKKVETLKNQLEAYSAQLNQEKKTKQVLLDVTRNDEKKYQELLARVRAEYQAIQGIVSGRGTETLIKEVSEGENIATLISGASCNSSGEHLHFIVARNGSTENPFNFLKPVEYENCSGSSCGSGDGDPFGPSGNWNWPINPKIKMTQGYGSTWATRNDPIIRQIYSFHNGVDITGSSQDVKAVQSGTLYQGSYAGGGGCLLRYVRVDHRDSDLDTLYLHINYVF